jgi:hypothetical protein
MATEKFAGRLWRGLDGGRATIGFDRVFDLLENVSRSQSFET